MTHPVREYRKRHDLTQDAFGKSLGVSAYTVHRLEARKIRELSLHLAIAIKKATGGEVTPEELAEAT